MTEGLSVRSLGFRYADRVVLRDVSFDAREGEFLAILGPNGAGKTTLLRCVDGVLPASSGSVETNGVPITRLPRAERARRLAYVPQRSVLAGVTAFDAVLLGRRPHVRWSIGGADIRAADAVMRRLGIEGLALRSVDEMSGGELQMTLLARALVQDPRVLLMDEPTGSLDPRHQMEILGIVRRIVREHHIAAVMTIHDINMALRFADRVLFLSHSPDEAGATVIHAAKPEEVTGTMIRDAFEFDAEIVDHNGVRVFVPADFGETPSSRADADL
jgi:iron complex transport system ATP-binding protein